MTKTRYRNKRKKLEIPRLCVKKSNTAMYIQLIDDTKGHTLLSMDTRKQQKKNVKAVQTMGKEFVKQLKEKNITKLYYDRSGYVFHGKLRTLFEDIQKGLENPTMP